MEATAKDASPQAVGTATTYLRRYSLKAAVGIEGERDDEDAEGAQPRGQDTPRSAKRGKEEKPNSADTQKLVAALVKKLEEAADRPALDKLAAEIGKDVKDGKLPESAKDRLLKVWKARKAVLEGTADPEPPPANETPAGAAA